MEPFLTRCPTCRSGLRVRRPEVVGQIVGCPKCSGMVLIERPSTEKAAANPANQQTTMFDTPVPKAFESSCDQIDHLLESPEPRMPATATTTRKRWRQSDKIPLSVDADRSMSDAHACGKPYTDSEMTPDPDWALKSKKRKTGWAKSLVLIASMGLLAAVAWNRLGPKHNVPIDNFANRDLAIATATPAPLNSTEKIAESPDEPLSEDNDVTADPSVAFASHRTNSTTAKKIAPVGHDQAVEEETAPAAIVDANKASTELTPIDNFSELFDKEENATAEAKEDDPLSTRPTSAARPKRAPLLRSLTLPDDLRARFKQATIEIHNEALPAKPVDVQARLADPIEDVRMNVGLSEMLRYVSSMSTIPFTIRPEALRYSRITPDKITPISAARTTVEELLSNGLARHSLDIKAVEGHVVVDRKKAVNDQITTNSHNVADLIDAGVSGPELISIVKQLIAPFSWTAIESPVEIFVQEKLLIMRHGESAHFQTMFLLERLRVARGMSLRGTMDRSEFENDWQRTAKLTQPVALRTKQIDSLGSVIRKLDQLAGNEHHVIADWQSLSDQGWISISPFSAEIRRQPLATALPDLLEPLGLAHRCVGPKLIEITTRASESQRREIGFHSIGALTQAGYDPQTVVRHVETTIGEHVFRRGGGRGVIVYNDGAQSLLVRLPQSQHAAVDWVIKELARTL